MSIFKRKVENRTDMVSESDTGQNLTTELLRALLGTDEVTREQALEIPTVNACVSKIASTVSSIPVKLYQEKNGQVEEIKNDKRCFLLNHDTKDTLTSSQFWRAMIEDYYLGKGAYAYINKFYMDYLSINYIDNTHISFLKNTDPIFKDYTVCVQGSQYSKDSFLKILRKTKDGHKSIPLQEEAPTLFSVAYNTVKYENTLVKKGGNKKGFITSENTITKDTIDSLREAFKKLYGNNEENIVVLNKGMGFKESSNSCVEMQMNENKETRAQEIAALFNMRVSVINGNASEEDQEDYISNCIIPLLNDIELSLDRDMLTESEKENNYYWAFDTKELKRGNIKERYEAYEIAYRNNFLQVDEIRNMEDMKPLGFDFIKLGLDCVLYNPKTHEIYTPNTNETKKIGLKMKGGEEDNDS